MNTFEEFGKKLDGEFKILRNQIEYLSGELQKQQEKDVDVANLLRALADKLEDKKY